MDITLHILIGGNIIFDTINLFVTSSFGEKLKTNSTLIIHVCMIFFRYSRKNVLLSAAKMYGITIFIATSKKYRFCNDDQTNRLQYAISMSINVALNETSNR